MRNDDGADYRPKLAQKFVKQARINNAERERERELFVRLGKALEEKVIEVLDQAIEVFFQKYEEQLGKIALRTASITEPIPPTYARIERRICAIFNVTHNEICARRKDNDILLARQAVMYWAVRLTGYSYPKIGRIMGGRDHTSIMYGATAYRQKREKMGRYLRKAR